MERVDGDVRDTALVARLIAEERVDTVIHLAAQALVERALEDPVTTFQDNVEGSWSVLEACRHAPSVARIVLASSDKAYGDWAGRPYHEDMALRPRHPYDASKAAADLLGQSYASTFGLPVVITRCGNLYGGGDLNWSRIVPGTIRSVLSGERPVIRSDGSPIRDYLHVQDAAAGMLLAANAVGERPAMRGRAYNLASRNRHSALAVVQRILRIMSSLLEPVVESRAVHEIPEQRLVATRARQELGWQPRVAFDDGLREAIDWYRVSLGRPA
jgi:CDP-glucose 4,6-dehydratase